MIPIVLHHGFFGFGDINVGPIKLSYFHGIDEALARRGHALIVSRVHPTGSIARRAGQLKEIILAQLRELGSEDERVLVIAHSMGGLDARYMINRLEMAGRVAALLTISTPHCGSPYADWCVKNFGQRMGALHLLEALGIDMDGATDLTTTSCRAFNEEIADAPGVRYYSISAQRAWHEVAPVFYLPHKIIADADGPNDGLVSVASAQWGKHLGTWRADHLETVGRRMLPAVGEEVADIPALYVAAIEQIEGEL